MNSSVSAASSMRGFCSCIARSWYSELSCMNWMPVASKIRSFGTFAKAFSSMPVGAGVAVVDGVAEDVAVGADEAEVDAPGVDADAVDRRAAVLVAVPCGSLARRPCGGRS